MSPKFLTEYQLKDMSSASKIPQNGKRQLLIGKQYYAKLEKAEKISPSRQVDRCRFDF